METKLIRNRSPIFVQAPSFLRFGDLLKGQPANDDFDDDPPPSASAPLPIWRRRFGGAENPSGFVGPRRQFLAIG